MEKTYTQKEMEKLCRNAMFHGELFGRYGSESLYNKYHQKQNEIKR